MRVDGFVVGKGPCRVRVTVYNVCVVTSRQSEANLTIGDIINELASSQAIRGRSFNIQEAV